MSTFLKKCLVNVVGTKCLLYVEFFSTSLTSCTEICKESKTESVARGS